MTELSRRWFLIGSAAALAATHIPAGAPFAQAVISPLPYKMRRICGIDCFFDHHVSDGAAPGLAEVRLFRSSALDRPIIFWQIDTRGSLRWMARDLYSEIIMPEQHSVVLDLRSPTGIGKIVLTCIDDGRMLQETHTFPNRGPAEIVYFDTGERHEA